MHSSVVSINNTLSSPELEMKIAKQCAPLLTGIKISNLLITPKSYEENIYDIFENTSINIKFLTSIDERNTFLLYRSEELIQYINQPDIQKYLLHIGYKNMDLEYILNEFALRYREYMKEKGLFPHEFGILLGYPTKDVIGFIENEGRNFLYTGYWKVYSNLISAMETFEQYDHAKELMTYLVSNGVSIRKILNVYHSKNTLFKFDHLITV